VLVVEKWPEMAEKYNIIEEMILSLYISWCILGLL